MVLLLYAFAALLLSTFRVSQHLLAVPLSNICELAAPVHQMQEYYRFGRADDCVGHWSNLYACLKKRTKFADQV